MIITRSCVTTAVPSVERFHINHVADATVVLICLVTLTFDLLALNRVRINARGPTTNFGVSGTFRSRLMGQHLLHAPCDLATFTFDLGGHGACL